MKRKSPIQVKPLKFQNKFFTTGYDHNKFQPFKSALPKTGIRSLEEEEQRLINARAAQAKRAGIDPKDLKQYQTGVAKNPDATPFSIGGLSSLGIPGLSKIGDPAHALSALYKIEQQNKAFLFADQEQNKRLEKLYRKKREEMYKENYKQWLSEQLRTGGIDQAQQEKLRKVLATFEEQHNINIPPELEESFAEFLVKKGYDLKGFKTAFINDIVSPFKGIQGKSNAEAQKQMEEAEYQERRRMFIENYKEKNRGAEPSEAVINNAVKPISKPFKATSVEKDAASKLSAISDSSSVPVSPLIPPTPSPLYSRTSSISGTPRRTSASPIVISSSGSPSNPPSSIGSPSPAATAAYDTVSARDRREYDTTHRTEALPQPVTGTAVHVIPATIPTRRHDEPPQASWLAAQPPTTATSSLSMPTRAEARTVTTPATTDSSPPPPSLPGNVFDLTKPPIAFLAQEMNDLRDVLANKDKEGLHDFYKKIAGWFPNQPLPSRATKGWENKVLQAFSQNPGYDTPDYIVGYINSGNNFNNAGDQMRFIFNLIKLIDNGGFSPRAVPPTARSGLTPLTPPVGESVTDLLGTTPARHIDDDFTY